jgi:hypothetical protein
LQGYNAQAVANEHQIVIAAEVMTVAPDFGHLEPMLDAAERELHATGVTEIPRVLVADAGYWHQPPQRPRQPEPPPGARTRRAGRDPPLRASFSATAPSTDLRDSLASLRQRA